MDVFFFKQKTAYEMRISDWSSDVCSSDLAGRPPGLRQDDELREDRAPPAGAREEEGPDGLARRAPPGRAGAVEGAGRAGRRGDAAGRARRAAGDRKSTRLNSSH